MVTSDGQVPTGPQLQSRPSLRINATRQSLTGGIPSSSPKIGPPTPSRASSSTRISSPGQLCGPHGSPTAAGGATTTPGGFGPAPTGDLPRLPCVSEVGEKTTTPRPPATVMLRRASTMNHVNLGRDSLQATSSSREGRGEGGESLAAVKKERNTLRLDKTALLLNKKRLEGFISKMLELPLPGENELPSALPSSGSLRSSLVRGNTLRAQLSKALEESASLEQQLALQGGGSGSGGGAAAAPTAAFSSFSGDSPQVQEYEAKISQMQAEYDMAVKHFESELSYRRTQAAASSAALQKQLLEAQEEADDARHHLQEAQTKLHEYYHRHEELRGQLQALTAKLSDKSHELTEAKERLGMDKTTMSTVIDMLRDQLKDANTDRAAKDLLIKELEYAIVHRDTLLSEAHGRINQAAQQAAASAAAGVSTSAAIARAAASMHHSPLDTKAGTWVTRVSSNGGGGDRIMMRQASNGGGGERGARVSNGGGGGGGERGARVSNGGGGGEWGARVSNGGGGGGLVLTSSNGERVLHPHHSHRRVVPAKGSVHAVATVPPPDHSDDEYAGEKFETEF